MFTFGFYNSKNEDRMYNAVHMGKIFDGVIQPGVFGTIHGDGKTPFQIEPTPTPSLNAKLNPGKAWLAHTWNILDSVSVLSFDDVASGYKRTDAVCIEINNNYTESGFYPRTNRLVTVKGTNVSHTNSEDQLPDLTEWQKKNSANEVIIWRYPLAYVTIYGTQKDTGTVVYNAHLIESVNIKTAISPNGATEENKYKTWTPLVTGATLDVTDYMPSTQDFQNTFNTMINQDQAKFNTFWDGITTSLVGEYVALESGESWQPNITYYELINGIYIPTTDTTQDPNKTYYYLNTADSINNLNNKIDNKILYGVENPPSSLEPGQVYFQYEE